MQPMLSQSSSSIAPDENIEYPILVLTQQPDSHNFNERRIVLNDTIKVGRSVARARPCESNAIFDCKVLSRNHAIFWFDNGKVLLKDTKSSNGTFVNSQLLSKGTEDSAPREIYTGDIIQFGVEVVENTTTHGCIIAQTTIYLSDGNELRRHSDMGGVPSGNIAISNYYEEQIYQLAQYIQEASHREQTLEKKLNSLSQLIIDTQEASDSSWKVILNQDRLMEKLELLQEQVDMHSKGDDHDSLTLELQRVLEQRYGMERESKSMLENLMEEKTDVLQRVVDLEQSLTASEEECAQLRTALDSLQSEHGQISERLSSGKDEVEVLQKKLNEAQSEYNNEISNLCQDKEAILARYEQLCLDADELRARLEDAETEISNRAVEISDRDQGSVLRDLLDQLSVRHSSLDKDMVGIETQLSRALVAEIIALEGLGQLEESMADKEASLDSCIMGATSDLGVYFIESVRHIRDGAEVVGLMKDELRRLQRILLQDKNKDDTSSTSMLEESIHDMECLLDKVDECQCRAKTLVAKIPERLLVHAAESALAMKPVSRAPVSDGDDDEVQTDVVSVVHCANQCAVYTDSVEVQVDLAAPKDLQAMESLQQCLDNLKTERCLTESLRMDLLQLQDDKKQLEWRTGELNVTIDELRQEACVAKQEMETKSDNVQRLANEGYCQLYEESQELRRRVQEIEEEMEGKRREYDVLYGQYEAMIAGQKNVVAGAQDNEKMRELEGVCARQQMEIEEMRDSMSSNYQSVVARARKTNLHSAQNSAFLSSLHMAPNGYPLSDTGGHHGLLSAPLLIRNLSWSKTKLTDQ